MQHDFESLTGLIPDNKLATFFGVISHLMNRLYDPFNVFLGDYLTEEQMRSALEAQQELREVVIDEISEVLDRDRGD